MGGATSPTATSADRIGEFLRTLPTGRVTVVVESATPAGLRWLASQTGNTELRLLLGDGFGKRWSEAQPGPHRTAAARFLARPDVETRFWQPTRGRHEQPSPSGRLWLSGRRFAAVSSPVRDGPTTVSPSYVDLSSRCARPRCRPRFGVARPLNRMARPSCRRPSSWIHQAKKPSHRRRVPDAARPSFSAAVKTPNDIGALRAPHTDDSSAQSHRIAQPRKVSQVHTACVFLSELR